MKLPLFPKGQPDEVDIPQVSKFSLQKNTLLLSMKYWMVNRDPYNGVLIIPIQLGSFSSPFIKQPTTVLFIAQVSSQMTFGMF